MDLPVYINAPDDAVAGRGCAACATCATCAACLGDGPIPDFEGVGIIGLAGLLGLFDVAAQ